jgi:uncharacterized surface protein with fasciclin (FAS1) repeats
MKKSPLGTWEWVAVVVVLGLVIVLITMSPKKSGTNDTTENTLTNNNQSITMEQSTKNIVETAIEAGSFSTLVAAVQAAGLAGTLSGPGPFTVFAPTDDAFAKLPEGTVESLLQNPEQLAEILKYHVVSGKVMASDVVNLSSATTVQGGKLTIDTTNGVMVNGAMVTATDIETSNGVIHVIDTVLLP